MILEVRALLLDQPAGRVVDLVDQIYIAALTDAMNDPIILSVAHNRQAVCAFEGQGKELLLLVALQS